MEIQLTQGKIAIVDDIDNDLGKIKWHADKNQSNNNNKIWYVGRGYRKNGKQIKERIHRVIMERIIKRKLKTNEHVDHINCNGLDNRRNNLRICNPRQNTRHQRKRCTLTSSKYKGVDWNKCHNKWRSRIHSNGTEILIGYFDNEDKAAHEYDNAAQLIFGSFCQLNFKNEDTT